MTHLYSSLFRLIPTRCTSMPPNQGQHIHAAFLDLIRQSEPTLAELLHDVNERKPFTVSMLEGGRNNGHGTVLREGEPCWLRFTMIGKPMFSALHQSVLSAQKPCLRLQHAELLLSEVLTTPDAHPWSGTTSAVDLVRNCNVKRKVTLQFYSPTAFEHKVAEDTARQLALTPSFVFGNLADKWTKMGCDHALNLVDWANDLAALGIVPATRPNGQPMLWIEALRRVFDDYIAISEMRNVNTQRTEYHRKPFVGTTGTIAYEVFGDSEIAQAVMRVMCTLADAAFYFGVGSKTTHGMGQTRRLSD